MLLKYLLILFTCYLPAYLALLFFLKARYPGYTIRSHMVSYLATCEEPWRTVFNFSTILYGALSLVLPVSLYALLGRDPLNSLGAGFLSSAGAATVMVGFFPMDRKIKIHNLVGFLAFLSALLTGIVFSAIFQRGMLSSPVMEMINFAVIGMAILLALSLLFRRQDSSLLEWVLMVCTIVWNFMLSTSLLMRMM